jgi:hypothetical protein
MMADTMTLEEAMGYLNYSIRKGEHSGGWVGGDLADAIDVVMTFVNETQGVPVPPAPSAWRPIGESSEERQTSIAVDLWGHLAKDQYRPCVPPRRITNCRFRFNSHGADSYWAWFTEDGERVAATHFMTPPAPPVAEKAPEGAEGGR